MVLQCEVHVEWVRRFYVADIRVVKKMAASTSRYHRPIDRGPERQDFHKLPEQDQQLISQLREAMVGARTRVTSLRDQVEDR